MNFKEINKNLIITLGILVFVLSLLLWKYVYPLSLLGIAIFIHQLIMFVLKLGKRLPIRELISLLTLLQLVLMPFLDYHIFPNLTFYAMTIPESEYMNYAVPANLFFIIGLQFYRYNKKIDYNNLFINIKNSLRKNPHLGLGLIIAGFLTGLAFNYVPASLQFLFLLISYLKYIGALYLIFSDAALGKFWFFIIYGSLLASSIIGGVFIDLFIWGIFLIIMLSFKFKLSLAKNISLLLIIFTFALSIQAVKGTYRAMTWKFEVTNPIGLFYSMLTEIVDKPALLFDRAVIDYQIARLNQGWIVSKVMNQVPRYVPFAGGETVYDAIKASILPRFASAEKSGAGNKYLFMTYTGHKLYGSTVMNLGLLGEAYVNFGLFLGALFVGLFGLLLNYVIFKIETLSEIFPTLVLWLPFLLTYPIRPGNDLAVLLNHLIKALVLTTAFFYLFRKKLKFEEVINPH